MLCVCKSSLNVRMSCDGFKGERTDKTFWFSLHWMVFLKFSPHCLQSCVGSHLWSLKTN